MSNSRPIPVSDWIIQPSLDPISEPAGPGGFSPSTRLQDLSARKGGEHLSAMVQLVLRDPLRMRQLSDRVYELLLEDLRNSQERHINYGGRF